MIENNKGLINKFESPKDNELYAVFEYLKVNTATATQVAVALNIYRPNLSRRKRVLEIAGNLAVVKKGFCPITKRWGVQILTTNPALFRKQLQLTLF
jgi:hypothetical protein